MAEQQGQGLQIALVVTIVLLIGMMVLAGIMYQNFSKCRSDVEALQAKLNEARRTQRLMSEQIESLVTLIGLPDPPQWVDKVGQPSDEANETGATVWARANAVLTSAQNKFGNDQSLTSLLAVIQRYQTELDKFQQSYQAMSEKVVPLLELIRQKLEDEKRSVLAAKDEELQRAREELRAVEAALDEVRKELETQSQTYRVRAQQATQRAQQLEKDLAAERQEYQEKLDRMAAQVRQLRRLTEARGYLGKPDGQILTVDAAKGYVIISVGFADNLSLMTRFSVWGADQLITPFWRKRNDEAQQEALQVLGEEKRQDVAVKPLQGPKAALEVTEILGPHQALARVVWYDRSRPIMVGDLIANPVWSPGRRHRVALVGLFDLDGDRRDDRELLKHLLKQNGCEIDLEVSPQGETEGEISPLTDWIVLGWVPGITADEDEAIQESEEGEFELHRITVAAQEIIREATNLGVPAITAQEFYEFLGYQPHSRVYDPGSYQAGTEAAARSQSDATQGSGTAQGNTPAPGFLRYIRY